MSPKNREHKQAKRQGASLLDEVLERRMVLYMLAAGATLGGASTAQAKVVFTPSNAVLHDRATLNIDMNNDGTTDFSVIFFTSCLGNSSFSGFYSAQRVKGTVPSNGAEKLSTNGYFTPALKRGARIGSSAAFGNSEFMETFVRFGSRRPKPPNGDWFYVTNRFLGVRFQINGETHYGWIGFRSDTVANAQLAGWAYETVPNKPIRAGEMGRAEAGSDPVQGSAKLQASEPTSLELLSGGNMAMSDWRRRAGSVKAFRLLN